MKTRVTSVRFSRKVHPRQYNPIEVEMSETVSLDPGEDVRKARRILFKRLHSEVDAACEAILEEEAPKKSRRNSDD